MNARTRSGMARRARARRGEGEKLRLEILTATEQLLAQTSDESAVSIRAVAEAVGITPPSIYLHFADKEELLIAVCERNFDEVSSAVEQAAAGASDPVEALQRAALAYARFGLEHPEQYRILFMRKSPPEVEEQEFERLRNSAGFNFLMGAVQESMDLGLIRRGDPYLVAVGLWSTVHGITSFLVCKPAFPWPPLEDIVTHSVRAYLGGLSS